MRFLPEAFRGPLIFAGIMVLVSIVGSYWYWNRSVRVALTISPAEASLILNGRDVAMGEDGVLHVKRGKHFLEVVSPGYGAHKETLDLRLVNSNHSPSPCRSCPVCSR